MRPLSIYLLALPLLCLGVVRIGAADEAGAKTEQISVFSAGTLHVPATFKRVPVKSRIIEHEFQVQVGEGDEAQTARVTMMAAGGDIEDNIKRWKGQFSGGDEEAQKTEDMKIGDWKVYIVDVNGKYQERVGGGPFAGGKVVERENYAMTGAILLHPEGRKFFVKMIGPAAVVKKHRKPFVEMIQSIKK